MLCHLRHNVLSVVLGSVIHAVSRASLYLYDCHSENQISSNLALWRLSVIVSDVYAKIQKVTIATLLSRRMIESQNLTSTNAITSTKSLSTESITGIVFGICATVGSIVTIWQAHRAWKKRHQKPVTNLTTGAKYELVETSTFATGKLSITTTEAPLSILFLPARFPLRKVPEACITAANHYAESRPLTTSGLNSVSEQIGVADMMPAESPRNARLIALNSALERLNMPFDELQASDYTRRHYTQATTRRLSTLKAAISQLTSSFDAHESGPS